VAKRGNKRGERSENEDRWWEKSRQDKRYLRGKKKEARDTKGETKGKIYTFNSCVSRRSSGGKRQEATGSKKKTKIGT
jgi:hypothetical protein